MGTEPVGRTAPLPPRANSWRSLTQALDMFDPELRIAREQPVWAGRRRVNRT